MKISEFKFYLKSVLFALILFTQICFSQENTFTQISTISALMDGAYDGTISISDLKSSGSFGLGTFDALDGEMIMTDGNCYKIKADGSIEIPKDEEKIPFASVTFFKPELKHEITNETDLKGIEKTINGLVLGKNVLYAISIKGRFRLLRARSVPKQQKPYAPLIEVVKKQSEFKFENVEGTIVGFKCPSYLKGLNVPGYHFHFISDDKKSGGHVLDFIISKADLQMEKLMIIKMITPSDDRFYNMDLESDKEQEIKKVESKK